VDPEELNRLRLKEEGKLAGLRTHRNVLHNKATHDQCSQSWTTFLTEKMKRGFNRLAEPKKKGKGE